MITATITSTNQTLSARTLADLRKQLAGLLNVGGWRALTAVTENRTIIHVSLYDGHDYIRTRDGKILYSNR